MNCICAKLWENAKKMKFQGKANPDTWLEMEEVYDNVYECQVCKKTFRKEV